MLSPSHARWQALGTVATDRSAFFNLGECFGWVHPIYRRGGAPSAAWVTGGEPAILWERLYWRRPPLEKRRVSCPADRSADCDTARHI